MRKHAEVAGFDRWRPTPASRRPRSLAAADGDLDAALAVLDNGVARILAATSRNRRWLSVLRAGLAIEAGDLRSPPSTPPTPSRRRRAARSACSASTSTSRPGRAILPAREQLSRLIPAMEEEGVRGAVAGARPAGRLPRRGDGSRRAAAARRSGRHHPRTPARRRPPLAAAHRRAARRSRGTTTRPPALASAAESSREIPFGLLAAPPGHRPRRCGSCLIALGDLDERPPPRDGGRELLSSVARVARRRARRRPATARHRTARLTGPRRSRLASVRCRRSLAEGLSNAGLAERLYISPAPRPCTCRTSCRSSAWRHGLKSRRGRRASGLTPSD